MRIDWRKIKSLLVETKSGKSLGKVKNIVFETDGQAILQYEVGNYFGTKYLISREQVVRFEENKMVVEDGVVKEPIQLTQVKKSERAIGAEPVIMRKMENIPPHGGRN